MTNFKTRTIVSTINLTQKEYDALRVVEEICRQIWLSTSGGDVEIDSYTAKRFIGSLRDVATVLPDEPEEREQPDAE